MRILPSIGLLLSGSFLLLSSGCESDVRPIEPCVGFECEPPPPCLDCCDGFQGQTFECQPPPLPPQEIDVSRSLPPLEQAATPPAPIAGGTLLIATSGLALAGDADRDRIVVVDLSDETTAGVVTSIELPAGSEPGRMIETTDGVFFAVLRGGRGVARIDAETWSTETFETCASPRGVAWNEAAGSILVSCLEGDLVTLDAASGEETQRVELLSDLRDIVIQGDTVFVSRFRSAEVLELGPGGNLQQRHTLGATDMPSDRGGSDLQPSIAYRMVAHPDGGVVVVHQLARTSGAAILIDSPGGYGGQNCSPSIVQAATTTVRSGLRPVTTALGNLVLPVDIAINPPSHAVAIAAAGSRTDDPTITGEDRFGFAGASFFAPRPPAAAVVHLTQIGLGSSQALHCDGTGPKFQEQRRMTAVAYDGESRLVGLSRNPLAVARFDSSFEVEIEVELPGESTYDAGHDLFFGDAGGGIACASCHAEGGEDGQVWTFEGIGPRRTQDIRGGILGTEPFHWDGDMADFQMLSQQVFAGRMLGPVLDSAYADVLAQWIDSMPYPERGDHVDALAAERGRALFESNETKCTLCHTGPRLAREGSYDVGTGVELQVPSLIGVALRDPYMHDGCADTLLARFDPSCGGETHGETAHLSEEQLADMVTYLESL